MNIPVNVTVGPYGGWQGSCCEQGVLLAARKASLPAHVLCAQTTCRLFPNPPPPPRPPPPPPAGAIQVTLKSPGSVSPYRIENACKDVCLAAIQTSLLRLESGKRGWYCDILKPGQAMPYAWDEPTRRNLVRVQVRGAGAGRRAGRLLAAAGGFGEALGNPAASTLHRLHRLPALPG